MADGNGVAQHQALIAGGAVQAIVPRSFEEAWRIAAALAASGLTPKDINSQEKVLAVLMAGAEIGMAPFQALQSFAVINGRVSLWGDGMLGVVRKHGVKVFERIESEGDKHVAICTLTRPDTKEEITRTFSVADAKRAGLWGKQGPWTQYPQRMLQMRARSWALRDGCADLLRGLKMAEEVQDYQEPEQARVVPDEYDQRPPDEIAEEPRGAFIMGDAWKIIAEHYHKLFDECDSLDALEKHWASFQRKYWVGKRRCIAHNSFDGMEHYVDNARIRFEAEPAIAARLEALIADCADIDELERRWADTHTEAMVARLPIARQTQVQALYEAAQERFADAVLAELDAARKAKDQRDARQVAPGVPSPTPRIESGSTRAALLASLEEGK